MRKLLFMASAALLVLMMFSGLLMTPGTAHAASVQTQTHATALAPTHPLMPAVTCSGNGCTGLDPIQTGCSASASTVLSRGIFNGSQRIGTINLRFSSVCQTNWAQVLSSIGSTPMFAQVTRASGSDGAVDQECEPVGCSSFIDTTDAFTNMVWAPDVPAQAVGTILQGNSQFFSCITQDQNTLPC